MSRSTQLSPAEKLEIQRAVEAGLSIGEAAKAFDLDFQRVKKMAQRGNWMTISQREKAMAETREKLSLSPKCPPAKTGVQALTETLAQKGENLRHLALKLSEKGLKQALSADLPIESWDDAKKAWEIGAKAAGLDKGEGASVTVLFGAPPAETTFAEPDEAQEAEIVDADVIDADE